MFGVARPPNYSDYSAMFSLQFDCNFATIILLDSCNFVFLQNIALILLQFLQNIAAILLLFLKNIAAILLQFLQNIAAISLEFLQLYLWKAAIMYFCQRFVLQILFNYISFTFKIFFGCVSTKMLLVTSKIRVILEIR